MSNDVERSESEAEAEKAAREWVEVCTDYTLSCEAAFLAGVEWERKRIRDTYCPSYVLAPTMENQGEAKLCHVIPVGDLDKE